MNQKGRNQIIAAKKAPSIGLSTFPNVLAVSIKPSPFVISCSSLNISPTQGITTGIAPAEPIP